MRCPKCNSEQTSLSWLREHTVNYWCRQCQDGFEIDRVAVQSTVRPDPSGASQPVGPEARAE